MSFEDKKFGAIFPVRDGLATGSSNERQMLDSIGGADSFRTRIQKNDDGSETMLRTKNGMPQFTTLRPAVIEPIPESLYMESGQLYFTFPGPENPDRSKAAKWRMLDISPSSTYMGEISPTEANPGFPSNKVQIFDDQDSIAIAPPSPEMKKMIVGMFPASLFSGKMRLFLQAQYGAKETSGYGLTIDVSGTQALLKYTYGGRVIQFGLWAHLSVGIFSAPDGTFWLIQIVGGATSRFSVFAYPIEILKRAKRLYDIYKAGAYLPGDKSKIEAYLFAHSRINVTKQMIVGGFDGSDGTPLAYGWKFNNSGSEASIVVHEALGVDVPNGESLQAKTMRVSISYTAVGSFQISASVDDGGEWTDGAGAYNIFVPEEELGTRLYRYSIAAYFSKAKPPFSFSNVPIYGYYKDDVWTPIALSRNMSPGGTGESQSSENIYVPSPWAGLYPAWYYGNFMANSGWTYSYKNLTNRWTMDISIGDSVVHGVSETGSFTEIEHTMSNPGEEGGIGGYVRTFYFTFGGGNGGTVSVPETAEYAASEAAFMRNEFPQYSHYVSQKAATFTWNEFQYSGVKYAAWVLVIPGSDCEAAYVAERSYSSYGNTATRYTRTKLGVHSQIAYGRSKDGLNTLTRYEWVGCHTCSLTLDISPSITYNTNVPEKGLKVTCFNAADSGFSGVTSPSYGQLFIVDINYPFYDPGMYMRTSAGYRYIGSEGVKNPDSVGNLPFVGWA